MHMRCGNAFAGSILFNISYGPSGRVAPLVFGAFLPGNEGDVQPTPALLLQVPAAVRRDLEALTAAAGGAAALVKEAATIAKYRLPGLAATLEVRRGYITT